LSIDVRICWAGGRRKFLDFFLPKQSQEKNRERVERRTDFVKLLVATELIRTAAPVLPVVWEKEAEKIGLQPGNTPLIRRE
jgi:hypothetical protein